MNDHQQEIMRRIHAAIANRATTDFERDHLQQAETDVNGGKRVASVLDQLKGDLRPLDLRNNLTPDVADIFSMLDGDDAAAAKFDLSRHYAKDADYEDRAIFAGGCFWCMVEPFDTRPGIEAVFSGYTGGHVDNPTYAQVSSGRTGHVEAVEIIFDTRVVSYDDLLKLYWQLVDPTDAMGQFADRGSNYRPVIFTRNAAQKAAAEASFKAVEDSGMYKQPIVVSIEDASTFWPAENFHQEFYKKNKLRYRHIEGDRKRVLGMKHMVGRIRRLVKTK